MSALYWIEASPRAADTAQSVDVSLAGGGTSTPYVRGNRHYRAGMVAPPLFSAALGYDAAGWSGSTLPQTTVLEFAPATTDLLTELAAYFWKDAPITIDSGEESSGAYPRLVTGTVVDGTIGEGKLRLTIADLSARLDKPVTTARFTGKGGLEGAAEAEGRVKRRSFGYVYNVEGRLLDKANSIYEFGDPAFPFTGWAALRDKGREGPYIVLAWQGSADATLAALKAASAAQGGGVVAPSIAMAKWWTDPAGPLTADFIGTPGSGNSMQTAALIDALSSAFAGPAVTGLVAANALRPGVAGVHIESAEETAAQAIDRLTLGVSLVWIARADGVIVLRPWAFTDSADVLQGEFIGREATYGPHHRRRLGYRRIARQHSEADLAGVLLYSDATPIDFVRAELEASVRGALAGASFIQEATPSAAQSAVGNRWIQLSSGLIFERVPGPILLDGKVVTLGGYRPAIYWTPSAQQPLAGVIADTKVASILAASAVEDLSKLDDDGIITRFEKTNILLPRDLQLEASYQAFIAVGAPLGIDMGPAMAARAIWLAIRNAIAPPYNDTSADSPAPSGYQSALDGYAAAIEALQRDVVAAASRTADYSKVIDDAGTKPADNADVTGDNTARDIAGQSPFATWFGLSTADVEATNAFAVDVADNTKFSSVEKTRYVDLINSWDESVPKDIAAANALGLTAQAAALQAAYTNLKDYLVANHYAQIGSSDSINRNLFKANVRGFTSALADLIAARDAKAATQATWSGVANDNGTRPADNADVTLQQPVVSKLDPANGRIIDGRALNANNNFGLRSLSQAPTLSSTAQVGSATVIFGGDGKFLADWGAEIALPSASFPGLANVITYYFWRNMTPEGASVSYGYSTDLKDALGPNKVYVAQYTTPTSSDAGGTGGSGSGYGTPTGNDGNAGGGTGTTPRYYIP